MISRMKFAKVALVGLAITASPAALAQDISNDAIAAERAAGAPFTQTIANTAAPIATSAAQSVLQSTRVPAVRTIAPTAAAAGPIYAKTAARVAPAQTAASYYQPQYYQTAQRTIPAQTFPAAQAVPVQYTREQWLEECYRRTGGKSNREKGNIIGGLLGAIAGGVLGNRVWDSERLAGTLIGAGTGGLLGAVAGGLLGGRKKSDYDCQEVLDAHMEAYSSGQFQTTPVQYAPQPYYTAARTIPAQPVQYVAVPVQTYAQPVTMIETQVAVPQRAVVREYVTEEWVEEPVRERVIEEPRPVKRVKRVPVYVKDQ